MSVNTTRRSLPILTPALLIAFSMGTWFYANPASASHSHSQPSSAISEDDSPDSFERPQDRRLAHARELMGSYYKRSIVRRAEKVSNLNDHVIRWTKDAMKGKFQHRARAVAETILAESRAHGFDPIFLMAVIESESSFNPLAVGTSGEVGMMQILPQTAKWMAKHEGWALKITAKNLRDPVINIKIGAAYLAYLRKYFDSHGRLYLSAYNMGAGNVNRALAKQIWPRDYPVRVMEKYIEYYRELRKQHS
jgi:soluble lytic murein transglycosylase